MKNAFLFLSAMVITAILVPIVKRASEFFNIFDMPSRRKVHKRPVSRLGGVAVILAFVFVFFIAFHIDEIFNRDMSRHLVGLFVSFGLLFFIGIWDDIWGVRAMVKFVTQILIGIVLFFCDMSIYVATNPFTGAEMPLNPYISLFITVFWVVSVINAINLIDGLDGLASGVVLIAGFSLIFVGLYVGTPVTIVFLSILCGCSLGFLFYNFHPAKIFLGDTGSMFLGLILAITGLIGLQYKTSTAAALLIPFSVMAIPISDILLAVGRRITHKKSIFIADKQHIHHRLLELGLGQREIVLLIYGAAAFCGIIAFLFVLIPNKFAFLLLVILALGAFFALRAVGYLERHLRRSLQAEKRVHELEKRLREKAE